MSRPATTKAIVGGPKRYCIYGQPGSGKSPVALSYPGKLVVANCDAKDVWCPKPADQYEFVDYAGCADPFSFLKGVLAYDWRAEGFAAIVIDTMTSVGLNYLSAAVNSGAYNTKAVTFGTNTLKLADKPHYGLMHNLVAKTLEEVKKCPMDVITVWHNGNDGAEGGVHGPVTANANRSTEIMRDFANILYTRIGSEQGKSVFYCHTAPYGPWPARINGAPSKSPIINITGDPGAVWAEIAKMQEAK